MYLEEEEIFSLFEVEVQFFLIRGGPSPNIIGKDLLAVEENLDPVITTQADRQIARRINRDHFMKIVDRVITGKDGSVKLTVFPFRLSRPRNFLVCMLELLFRVKTRQALGTGFLIESKIHERTGVKEFTDRQNAFHRIPGYGKSPSSGTRLRSVRTLPILVLGQFVKEPFLDLRPFFQIRNRTGLNLELSQNKISVIGGSAGTILGQPGVRKGFDTNTGDPGKLRCGLDDVTAFWRFSLRRKPSRPLAAQT